jgi:alpha-ketoglutarate-dependent taurine dioxygenase
MAELSIEPLAASPGGLAASFGARITGVNLAELSDEAWSAIEAAFLEHALLIFPDQFLADEVQVAFAKRFGAIEFELAPITNARRDGSLREDGDPVMEVLRGNEGWHCDSTYMPVSALGAVFTAEVVPSRGGETGWADMRAAYEALDPAMREKISKLSAYHSLKHSQQKIGHDPDERGEYSGYGFHDDPPPLRPLVKIHPVTKRPSLMIGRHAYGIPGLAPDESEKLLDELVEFACRPPRTYEHSWSAGDAVIWDNRCLLHRARPWDHSELRRMKHTRIAGDPRSEGVAA